MVEGEVDGEEDEGVRLQVYTENADSVSAIRTEQGALVYPTYPTMMQVSAPITTRSRCIGRL